MTAFLSPEYVYSKWCQFKYIETRKTKKPPVHAIFWKRLNLGIAFLPYHEELSPEGHTDVMYLRENPSPEELKHAAKECVADSIKLIQCYYLLSQSNSEI